MEILEKIKNVYTKILDENCTDNYSLKSIDYWTNKNKPFLEDTEKLPEFFKQHLNRYIEYIRCAIWCQVCDCNSDKTERQREALAEKCANLFIKQLGRA